MLEGRGSGVLEGRGSGVLEGRGSGVLYILHRVHVLKEVAL